MNKVTRVILIDKADLEYKLLNELIGKQIKEGKKNTDEMQLLRSIRQKIDFIKSNPFYGDNIPKEQIPKEYKVQNLWRVELSQFWRMLYTLTEGESQIEIIAFVLDVLNHKDYNKKFGYK